MAARTHSASVGDETFSVRVDGHTVSVVPASGATSLEVESRYLGHGRVVLRHDGVAHVAWVVEAGDARWVFADGRVTLVEVGDGSARTPRRAPADAHPTLFAPMPATVVRILAGAGTRVERGAVIVLLEAMKMELPLRAPHDAIVTAIHCREGELVQPNVALVELGAAPAPPELAPPASTE